jgi:hypothetical protein
MSPPKAANYTRQRKHRRKADRCPCHEWDSNTRSQYLSKRIHFVPQTETPRRVNFYTWKCVTTGNESVAVTEFHVTTITGSRESSLCVATGYGLDDRGLIPGWDKLLFSSNIQTGSGAHPASRIMGTPVCLGVRRLGCEADHSPHLVLRSRMVGCTSTAPFVVVALCVINLPLPFTRLL